ncbi:hypothetical protein KCP75_17435 [Salmonella enterica subsp. enterica]|nr:hypothetical protein KCP75_17435 [Salmonella enterica subsp. enterica]
MDIPKRHHVTFRGCRYRRAFGLAWCKRKSGPWGYAASAVNHLWCGGKHICLTMIINPAGGHKSLHHQREVGAGRKLLIIFVNIRGLNAERYTGGQSMINLEIIISR